MADTQVQAACPRCGEPGKPVLYGLPTPAAREAAIDGYLITPGCLEPEEADDWQCKNGHGWRIGDKVLWDAAVRLRLRGRPRCPICGGATVQHIYPGTIGEDLWREEIESGEVILADAPGPPGVNWDQLCRSCGNVWSPR